MTSDNIGVDRSTRPFAVAGVLVGAVALLGFDLTYPAAAARGHKSPSAMVHAVAPGNSAAIVMTPALAGSALVLALMLWLGRQSIDSLRGFPPIEPVRSAGCSTIPPMLRSRVSISYHTGGLYGP